MPRSASARSPTQARSRRGSDACAAWWSRRRPISRGAARRSARTTSRRTTSSCSAGSAAQWEFGAAERCASSPRLTVTTAEAAIDAVGRRHRHHARARAIRRSMRWRAAAVVRVLARIRTRRDPGASALSGRRASAAEAARLCRFRGAAAARAARRDRAGSLNDLMPASLSAGCHFSRDHLLALLG